MSTCKIASHLLSSQFMYNSVETITRGSGFGVGFVLVDKKRQFFVEKIGWMTL